MGMPVIIVDLRSKCILARCKTFSNKRVAGKEYNTDDTADDSCRGEGGGVETGVRGEGGKRENEEETDLCMYLCEW